MIKIYLNAEQRILQNPTSLMEALTEWGYSDNFFAIAINRNFIPHSQYQTTFLQEGDTIEVVTPMQGG